MTQSSEIFSKLWNLLNKRRGNGNIDILRHIVPDLIFLFAVSVRYEKEKNNKPRFETFDDPVYFTLPPPPESQWKNILKCLKRDPQNIKDNVCKALEAIEKVKVGNNSLEGLTYKEYFKSSDLTDYDLQQIINEFDEEFQEFSKQSWGDYDFLGNAYQFFLQQFAAEGGQQGGQFYTPSDVVELLVRLLQIDKKGAIVYDPCCGSGGMFVKTNRLNIDIRISFYRTRINSWYYSFN